ncbi:unnamed protein product [Durusdinium trenchii]|uniref:Uncharacterized protein n=1 Tax=Durusdinium trenchii TaxID=1381693 RepID=A0ABP0PCP3_9DINO
MSMLLSGAAPQKGQDVHLLVTGKDSDGHFASTPLQIHVTDTSDWADWDNSFGICLVLRSVCFFSGSCPRVDDYCVTV